MKAILPIPAAAAAALLAGCASSGHCTGQFDYQTAYSLPAVKVEGLKLPTSSSALVIPPAPAGIVPYANEVPDSENPRERKTQCLDTPPRMPQPAPAAPAAEKS